MSNESFLGGGDPVRARPRSSAGGVRLAGLRSQIAGPLIGTPQFTDAALTKCDQAARRDAASPATAARYKNLGRAVSALTKAPFAAHNVATLAQCAGMSRSSFALCFTATFGLGPLAFLKAERMRYAAHLLLTTSLPVKAVSLQIGYGSFSYFSRAFRAKYGVAPKEIAKMAAFESGATDPGDFIVDPLRTSRIPGPAGSADLQSLCDAVLDVMWTIDLASGRVWWSEGMSKVFGYGADQIGPTTAWCHEHIHPDDRQRVVAGMQRACASGDQLWEDEFRYRKADGAYAHVIDRGIIERNSEGVAVRFSGVMHDVSKVRLKVAT